MRFLDNLEDFTIKFMIVFILIFVKFNLTPIFTE